MDDGGNHFWKVLSGAERGDFEGINTVKKGPKYHQRVLFQIFHLCVYIFILLYVAAIKFLVTTRFGLAFLYEYTAHFLWHIKRNLSNSV